MFGGLSPNQIGLERRGASGTQTADVWDDMACGRIDCTVARTANMTKLAKYSQELYGALEEETGVATGFKRVGSITVALTDERMEELSRSAAMARAFGVEIEEISPAEVGARYEHLNLENVVGGVYLPKDGQGDPANIALAMAKGARMRGAIVQERVRWQTSTKTVPCHRR